MRHDPAAAGRLLDAAGLPRGADGVRRLPDGKPLRYEVLSVAGWSDWVRAAQVIARGLQEAGVDASVRTYDFSAWFQRVQAGDFDLSLGWSFEGPTPYLFYRWLMSSATVKPVVKIPRAMPGGGCQRVVRRRLFPQSLPSRCPSI